MSMMESSFKEDEKAYKIVRGIQKHFVSKLNSLSLKHGKNIPYEEILWLRDQGIHGGGSRFQAKDFTLFNTASVNVSQVHYDENENKNLLCATAVSTIIHPNNPKLPSMHMHISYTRVKNEKAYWRVMADLNPSNYNQDNYDTFNQSLKNLSKEFYEEGRKQGDKYFYIPCLKTHRGVSHFYLENHYTSDEKKDYDFASGFGLGIIDTYIEILSLELNKKVLPSQNEIKKQLDYHSLYLFQVLVLDRGTSMGVLSNSQNDLGIMASLPTHVNKKLLTSWIALQKTPQDDLLEDLVECIQEDGLIDNKTKENFALIVRSHYRKHPEALSLQASGNTIPKIRISAQK